MMRKTLVGMGLAAATAAGVLTIAPGTAEAAAGECQWVDRQGELQTFSSGDVLSIEFADGTWESWQCGNGSWNYLGQLAQ